jgi:arsenite oxidase small subunit
MQRRSFIKVCGIAAALTGLERRLAHAADGKELGPFARVRLVDDRGRPLRAQELSDRDAYVFRYPYQSTPCFLIKLRRPAAAATLTTEAQQRYDWRGGAGPDRTIVAFSAICAHQLSYPSKFASAINYYSRSDPDTRSGPGAGLIMCCAHGSIYDPSQGAKVVAGPAPQPLAAVTLEYEPASDGLYAAGVIGGAPYEGFFKAYRAELLSDYGPGVARQFVEGTAVAVPMPAYTKTQLHC